MSNFLGYADLFYTMIYLLSMIGILEIYFYIFFSKTHLLKTYLDKYEEKEISSKRDNIDSYLFVKFTQMPLMQKKLLKILILLFISYGIIQINNNFFFKTEICM